MSREKHSTFFFTWLELTCCDRRIVLRCGATGWIAYGMSPIDWTVEVSAMLIHHAKISIGLRLLCVARCTVLNRF